MAPAHEVLRERHLGIVLRIDFRDRAVDAFNVYRGDPVGLLDRALEIAPALSMAHIFKAHLYDLATEPRATADARTIVEHVETLPLNDREVSHVEALEQLLNGNWTAAAGARERVAALRCPHAAGRPG